MSDRNLNCANGRLLASESAPLLPGGAAHRLGASELADKTWRCSNLRGHALREACDFRVKTGELRLAKETP